MQEKPTAPIGESPTVKASLETFRMLSLPEKALAIAQTQAMLFSNTVVRTLAALLRGAAQTPPKASS
ncbi:MAG: hypothetical protein NZ585_09560 [Chloracidobacterium sp.]|nr:hypothetical protein [Chloracidobacterium sp.]MDW8216974.1 hypothetical protein [Acidobacteriota bacterium]